MDKIYAVIPAYNEQDNIKDVINGWYDAIAATSPESRLVIIDDGSRDDTLKIAREEEATHPQLIVLHKENSGHGATILYGYKYAIENGADFVFQTDSDGQTLPEEFPAFFEKRNEYDFVIGHRKERKDGKKRIFTTRVLRLVIRIIFGVYIKDANTPFRLMSSSSLKECLKVVPKDYNLTNVIVSVAYARLGYKGLYIPVTFRPRQGGVNSINMKKIFKTGFAALRDFRNINKALKAAEKEKN